MYSLYSLTPRVCKIYHNKVRVCVRHDARQLQSEGKSSVDLLQRLFPTVVLNCSNPEHRV